MEKRHIQLWILFPLLVLAGACSKKVYDPPLEFYKKPEFEDCSQVKERNCELRNLVLSYDFKYNKGDMGVTRGEYYLIDTNRDDLYDLLLIEINVKSIVEGDYKFYIHLANKKELLIGEKEQKIKKGNNRVRFDFKTGILKSRNYTISAIISKGRENILYELDMFSLNIGSSVRLEEAPFTVEVVSHEYTNTDDDPEFEMLQLNAVFDIKKSGAYGGKVWIGDTEGRGSLIYLLKNISLEEGRHQTAFLFDSRALAKKHWDKIRLYRIETAYENTMYENLFNYTVEDFRIEMADKDTLITGPFSEETIDKDDNGLIDLLVVNSGVYCAEKGDYVIEGGLFDMYGSRVLSAEKEVQLEKGQQTVKIEFDGIGIYSNKINGPYLVKYISISKNNIKNNIKIDSVLEPITTKMYNYSDFEKGEMPDITITKINKIELDTINDEVTAVVENKGKAYGFEVMLSFFDGNFNLIEEKPISVIAPDETAEIKIKADKKSGKVYVVADYNNRIEESNESNNLAGIMV